MNKINYYTTEKIDKTNAQYRIIYGERSNGKTTACLRVALENFCNSNFEKSTGYIRRYREDKKGFSQICSGIINLKWVEKYSRNKYNSIQYWQGKWFLVKLDKDGVITEKCTNPFMYGFCLSEMERYKSQSFPSINTIIFDEFLTRSLYLQDEFILFQNMISTIVRERDNVVIYMLGNAVNMYCPYFEEMGLKNIKNQAIGTIDVYEYGETKLKVAVERSDGISKKSDVYFAFGNPRLSMITKGEWEIDIYPHLPLKYKPKDKILTYYIDFKGEKLACDIIYIDKDLFTYVHRKTTPITEEYYPVYTTEFSSKLNYSNDIMRPRNKVEKLISKMFVENKVCYQTNEIGEIVRNFLNYEK